MHTTSKPTMTPRELADRLQVSEATAWRLGREERIPGVFRVGRLMRFDAAAVEIWIAARGTHAGAEGAQ